MLPGIIGRKIGMTQLFQESGEALAVTAIQAGPSVVTQVKSRDRDGYDAIQVGFVEDNVKQSRLSSSEKGHLRGLENVRYLREFRVDDTSSVNMGDKVDISFLKQGDLINITGFSKGRGFAGVVKRYHFAGGPKPTDKLTAIEPPVQLELPLSPVGCLKGSTWQDIGETGK